MKKLTSYKVDISVGDNDAESILSFVAYGVLTIGLFVSVVLGIYVGKHGEAGDGWKLFFGMAFTCAVVWAGSMILINISNNLRCIKHLLAYQQRPSYQRKEESFSQEKKKEENNIVSNSPSSNNDEEIVQEILHNEAIPNDNEENEERVAQSDASLSNDEEDKYEMLKIALIVTAFLLFGVLLPVAFAQ